MEDDPRVPERAFVLKADRETAEAAAIGLAMYIGALSGAMMVVASGGAVATVLLAAAAGGAVGGGLGGMIAAIIGSRYADRLEASIREGGLLLWVVAGNDEEKRAGGADVHAHHIVRTWGEVEPPFKNWNPDPVLD